MQEARQTGLVRQLLLYLGESNVMAALLGKIGLTTWHLQETFGVE